MCGFYDVSPEKFGRSDNVIGQASHFGTQEEVYDGVRFQATARGCRAA